MIKYVADENLVLKKILDDNILIPVGEHVFVKNSIITLNETALFIWQQLKIPASEEELAQALTKEYDVCEAEALADIKVFLVKLINSKAIKVINTA